MGQYYKAAILGRRFGLEGFVRPRDYDNGMKLMEHSYVGNFFVNAVLSEILNTPKRVAWIGDYSTDADHFATSPYKNKLSFERFEKIYDALWGEKKKQKS